MLIVFNIFQTVGFYGFSQLGAGLPDAPGHHRDGEPGLHRPHRIAAPLGPALGWFLTDRIERKWLIVAGRLGVALFGLGFGQMRAPFLIVASACC